MPATSRPRAVLDTNVIVSGLIALKSAPGRLLLAWESGGFQLVGSADLVAELADVLSREPLRLRFSADPEQVSRSLSGLENAVVEELAVVDLPISSRYPNDDKVLACAFGSKADYIVTGDKDLLVLDGDPACGRLRIITPAAFLELLSDE